MSVLFFSVSSRRTTKWLRSPNGRKILHKGGTSSHINGKQIVLSTKIMKISCIFVTSTGVDCLNATYLSIFQQWKQQQQQQRSLSQKIKKKKKEKSKSLQNNFQVVEIIMCKCHISGGWFCFDELSAQPLS